MTLVDRKGDAADREIVLSRVVDAPRELVWKVWTEPEHVVRWWGPDGFTTSIKTMDVRKGGVWEHVMRGPDGVEYPNKSVFREVVRPERIVYAHGGNKRGAKGVSFVVTWTFEEAGPGRTKLTGRMVFPTAAERERVVKEYGAIDGGKQHLRRLAEYLAAQAGPADGRPDPALDLVFERVVDVPPDLVWKAWTTPEHLKKWFCPLPWTTTACEIDLRPGGAFRTVMRSPEGKEFPNAGCYLEVEAPRKLVWTSVLLPGFRPAPEDSSAPGFPFTAVLRFEPDGSGTKYTAVVLHKDADGRKRHEAMGFHDGWGKALDQLVELARRTGLRP
jgi:uncharacterized protein YndB with AHSA1/START domain